MIIWFGKADSDKYKETSSLEQCITLLETGQVTLLSVTHKDGGRLLEWLLKNAIDKKIPRLIVRSPDKVLVKQVNSLWRKHG